MADLLHNENTIYWPRKPGLRKILGDLEIAIMEEVWSRPAGERATIRAIYDVAFSERKLAYTTVMTTVQRLADKGLLAVDKAVYPHEYWAPLTQEKFTRQAIGQLLDDLLADFAEPAFAHLADRVEAEQRTDAARLLGELQERRKDEER